MVHLKITLISTTMKIESFEILKKFINEMPDLVATERKELIAVISELVDDNTKIKFQDFWDKYPKKQGKFNAEKTWKMMSARNQHLALELLPLYINAVAPYVHKAENYMHKRMWMDYMEKPKTKDDLFNI